MHHIGGRNGSYPFPYYPIFKDSVSVYLYDADPSCINEIENINLNQNYDATVLNNAIYKATDTNVDFFITKNPYNSSLLKKNSIFNEFIEYHGEYDSKVNDNYSVSKIIKVNTTSLDNLFSDFKNNKILKPNILSLDTQGTELSILKNSTKILEETIVIQLEFNFINFYNNQNKNYDILKFLETYGFELIEFQDIKRGARVNSKINFRGNGQYVGSDVFFIKKPSFIINSKLNNEKKIELLKKIMFLSIIYKQFEFSLHAFEIMNNNFMNVKFNQDIKIEKF
ncbi:FkbM family methyltransferase, partial [Alphaproteobacteria bacterium]|nr:FkbM family methyltransferase [Alphaproteobacteria bacterium]